MGIDVTTLDSLSEDAIDEILQSWTGFCACTESLLASDDGSTGASISGDVEIRFASFFRVLCSNSLTSLVIDHFLHALEERFKQAAVLKAWKDFDASVSAGIFENDKENWSEQILKRTLKEIVLLKSYQESCTRALLHCLQQHVERSGKGYIPAIDISCILSKYQLMVSSTLLTSLPSRFPEVLCIYFSQQLENLSKLMSVYSEEDDVIQIRSSNVNEGKLHAVVSSKVVDDTYNEMVVATKDQLVRDIGMVVCDLRNLGFSSLSEDAYASAIFCLLKTKVNDLAGDDYHIPVLESIKEWIKAVALRFLYSLLAYLGDAADNDTALCVLESPLASRHLGTSISSEGFVRWQLRLEYFAYEMLQDLRIGKLFEIIVDYPDSSPAIDDLKKCLEYTGQYSKLVDSFISSLRYRLLTAGASTNDILHQYVSTIKALRTVDPSGVFLEAVTEPIRDYLRGRKDTIKCIVTMLTDGSGGNPSGTGTSGDSLLEELNRDAENKESVAYGDEYETDDKQAWPNAERWEPDPVAAGPLKGCSSRRKIDILGMMVGIIGSKDQLVNEYRVMLAERLLNKSDYDIDSDIRTLELLKIHFGESSMQKCEIMLNDLIDSKRINTNIKASVSQPYPIAIDEKNNNVTLDILDATIISSNFWPTIQAESINIPDAIDTVLSDYAKRYHEIKAPRKLLWFKNLGSVKLELQFEGRSLQFTVAPVHAVIIMKFQEQKSWNLKDLANATGLPVDTLKKRITFWISKGIIAESHGAEAEEHIFTIIDETADMNRNDISIGTCEGLLANDDERESSVVSVEEQLQKEMSIYEKFIMGMLTNFGSMALERIHNTLKMFCIAEPTYDKSLQQLHSFLSCLVSEEKLDIRDGLYFLRK